MVPSPAYRMLSHSLRASPPVAILSPVCVPVSVNTCLLQTELSPRHMRLPCTGASSLGHPGAAYLGSANPTLHPLSCVDIGPLASGISQNVHTAQPVEEPHSSASSQKSQGTGGWRVWRGVRRGVPQRRSSAAVVPEHLSCVVYDMDSQSSFIPQLSCHFLQEAFSDYHGGPQPNEFSSSKT